MSNMGFVKRNYNIAIQMTGRSLLEDVYSSTKDKLDAEISRIDRAMIKFNADLMQLYGKTSAMDTGMTLDRDQVSPTWEDITKSTLVEGEGNSKSLKLQYDVSQFDATEVRVAVMGDSLIVTARHDENSNDSSEYRHYSREFFLPRGIDTDSIVSELSKDGILTVNVPLKNFEVRSLSKALSK